MKIVLKYLFLFLFLGIFNIACISRHGIISSSDTPDISLGNSFKSFQDKAIRFEEEGEIQKAIYYWKITGAMAPQDEDIAMKIIQLNGVAKWLGNRHFRKGVVYYEKDQEEEALEEFLIALRYNPSHKKALEYIKERLPLASSFIQYEVQPGDTFYTIAKNVYNDPEKAFLISYLLDDIGKYPTQGLFLSLPKLQQSTKSPIKIPSKTTAKTSDQTIVIDFEKELALANYCLQRKDYQGAIEYLRPLLGTDHNNPKVREIANHAYYEWGTELIQSQQPVEALKKFENVDPGYRDVDKQIISLKVFLKEQGEAHYLKGLKYFVKDNIELAIKEWEQTLFMDPEHVKAKKDLENAKGIIEKLRKVD